MVKITLEFATVEEALLALGKQIGGRVARAANKAPDPNVPPAPLTATPAAEKPPRRGRSDAGKSRGPYNKVAAETVPGAQQEAGTGASPAPGAVIPATPELPLATPTAQPAVESAPVPASTAQGALESLFNAPPPKGGLEASVAILKTFGVQRLRDLPAGKYAEFIAAVNAVLAA